MPKINSKQKGSRGERELTNFIKSFGFTARRTQQYCGSTGDASDVIVREFPELHFESKRTERLHVGKALAQIERDCGEDKVPVICHKKNRQDWVAVMSLEDLLLILQHSEFNRGKGRGRWAKDKNVALSTA